MGWGQGPWGATPWGSGGGLGLELLSAQAIRENVIRLTFDSPILFTGTGEPGDGSVLERYQIVAQSTPLDARGNPARAVRPAGVELSEVAGAGGRQVDVTTDRPMSPYPTRYSVAVNALKNLSGGVLVPGSTSVLFDALFRGIPRPLPDNAVARRDIANPQTRSAFFDPLPEVSELLLGTLPVDEQGDYAFDEGLTSVKKRIFRRVITRRGKFGHLKDYGVGVPAQVKKLGSGAVRETLAADAESQILEEPEVERVAVSWVQDAQRPNVFRMQIRAKTTSGDSVNLDVPFDPTKEE